MHWRNSPKWSHVTGGRHIERCFELSGMSPQGSQELEPAGRRARCQRARTEC